MTSNWPTLMGNLQRTGYCQDAFRPPLELAWSKRLEGYVSGSPIIVGHKLIVSREKLSAFELQTGEHLWTSDITVSAYEGVVSTPLFYQDALWVAGMEGIYQLDVKNGNVLKCWPYELSGGSLVVIGQTAIWVDSEQMLYTWDLGQAETGTIEPSDLSMGLELGSILSADGQSFFWFGKFEKQTSLRTWDLQKDSSLWGSSDDLGAWPIGPPLVSDSRIYINHRKGGLSVLDAQTGKVLLRLSDEEICFQTPLCVTPDYVCGAGRALYALDRKTGVIIWYNDRYPQEEQNVDFEPAAPICIGSTLYICGGLDHSISAFDATTGEIIWQYPIENNRLYTPAYANGHLLIGSHDGYLYCFRQAQAE